MLSVLKACSKIGTVKRLVLTSSSLAVSASDDSHEITEEDWTAEENISSYIKGNVSAEREAWDFTAKLENDKKFELAVVNPGFVVSPLLLLSKINSVLVDVVMGIFNKEINCSSS